MVFLNPILVFCFGRFSISRRLKNPIRGSINTILGGRLGAGLRGWGRLIGIRIYCTSGGIGLGGWGRFKLL